MNPNNPTWAVFTADGVPQPVNTQLITYPAALGRNKGTEIHFVGTDKALSVDEDIGAVMAGILKPLAAAELQAKLGDFGQSRKAG